MTSSLVLFPSSPRNHSVYLHSWENTTNMDYSLALLFSFLQLLSVSMAAPAPVLEDVVKMKSKVKWMAEQLVVKLNKDFQVTYLWRSSWWHKISHSLQKLCLTNWFMCLLSCRFLLVCQPTHPLILWKDLPPWWWSWRVTTAWYPTAWTGSPRSSLKSPRWRHTSITGPSGTAGSSGWSLRCRGRCRSCRAGKSSFTPWASRLLSEWRRSSICCWKIWTTLRLAERRTFGSILLTRWPGFWICQVCISKVCLCHRNLFLNTHLFI